MCRVVKVHALWEPAQKTLANGLYDATALLATDDHDDDNGNDGDDDDDIKAHRHDKRHGQQRRRALDIASMLGLQPIGWIYSYSDDRVAQPTTTTSTTGEDALPVSGNDVLSGAVGQIRNMKLRGRDAGRDYLTLALDARSGATEAFQLSDVAVQMVAEGVLPDPRSTGAAAPYGRILPTADPVVVDGEETEELDSVLCLVNTAVLSHEGRYAGKRGVDPLKKGGRAPALSARTRRSLLQTINDGGDGGDAKLLQELCDFNLLLALDRSLDDKDTRDLCALVSKYTRGQKKGTVVPKELKLILKTVLDV